MLRFIYDFVIWALYLKNASGMPLWMMQKSLKLIQKLRVSGVNKFKLCGETRSFLRVAEAELRFAVMVKYGKDADFGHLWSAFGLTDDLSEEDLPKVSDLFPLLSRYFIHRRGILRHYCVTTRSGRRSTRDKVDVSLLFSDVFQPETHVSCSKSPCSFVDLLLHLESTLSDSGRISSSSGDRISGGDSSSTTRASLYSGRGGCESSRNSDRGDRSYVCEKRRRGGSDRGDRRDRRERESGWSVGRSACRSGHGVQRGMIVKITRRVHVTEYVSRYSCT